MNGQVYLDYNATVPALPEVVKAVTAAMEHAGNASSVHTWGREARKLVEDARDKLAKLIDARASQIIFTGGGSEANNLALKGCGLDAVLVSAIEHDSVLNAMSNNRPVSVDSDGVLDLQALEFALSSTDRPAIVSVMLANNETGVIPPIAEAAEIASKHNALIHCDAIQALGKIDVDWQDLNVDFLSLSAHKVGGPQGVGALVINEDVALDAMIKGGGQERGRRAGTENVAGIVGLGVAARLAAGALDDFARLAELRDALESRVRAIAPEVTVFGEGAARLPNTAKFTMPGVSSETQVIAMDLAGICISAGSACSAGKVEPPYVLTAMGVADDLAVTAVRVSLGWASRPEHIDRFVAAWDELYRRAGARAA